MKTASAPFRFADAFTLDQGERYHASPGRDFIPAGGCDLVRVLNTNVNDELAVRAFALSIAIDTGVQG